MNDRKKTKEFAVRCLGFQTGDATEIAFGILEFYSLKKNLLHFHNLNTEKPDPIRGNSSIWVPKSQTFMPLFVNVMRRRSENFSRDSVIV
jgi:hypothetical protein